MTNSSTTRDGRSRRDGSSREGSSVVSRGYRPEGRDASTATARGFRLPTTQPGRGRAGTTLNLDTDEVYRWYSLGVPHLLAAGAHAGAVCRNAHGEDARAERPARAPLSSELRHCTACPRPKSSAAEATWTQPLIREDLS